MNIEQNHDIDASWSKLLHSEMGEFVAEYMDDPRRKYHNINHVRRLYEIANLLNIPYYSKLDLAILWHDVVYDEHPDKEIRSAELLKETAQEYPEWFEGVIVSSANEMILNTINHKYIPQIDPWLIRLDTTDLSYTQQRYENFWLIVDEAKELYGIDFIQAAKNTIDFMEEFYKVAEYNIERDLQYGVWRDIRSGCEDVSYIAQAVLETYERLK